MTHYASMRTNDCKGVTIPSQRRYVDYYATMAQSWRQPGPESLQYNPVKMYLTSIVIDPLPQMGRGQQEGFIQVRRYTLENIVSFCHLRSFVSVF